MNDQRFSPFAIHVIISKCLCGVVMMRNRRTQYSIHVDTVFIDENLIETFYERIISFSHAQLENREGKKPSIFQS